MFLSKLKKKKKIILTITLIWLIFSCVFFWRYQEQITRKLTTFKHSIISINHTPEHIDIIIHKKRLKKINSLRKRALEHNDFTNAKKNVKGLLIKNGDSIRVKLKLKGDQFDHYNSSRFSLRVTTLKKESIWGTSSIQHPKTRQYINEWIFHELLKKSKLPYLKYEFITVSINEGKSETCACEQYFSDSQIFKNWGGKAGPILGFKDHLFWKEYPDSGLTKQYDTQAYQKAKIKVFNSKNIQIEKNLFSKAEALLYDYQHNVIPADSLFDMKKIGRFYALMDLLGGKHALRWINVRYYFNPETNLFEPLGYDSNNGTHTKMIGQENYLNSALHQSILDNPEFLTNYHKALHKIKDSSFLDAFFSDIESELNYNLKTIYISDPNYTFNKMSYYTNQKTITQYLQHYSE